VALIICRCKHYGSKENDHSYHKTDIICLSFMILYVGTKSNSLELSNLLISDKELDVIEMAVYGNVMRPGLQCRCKSVAEMLGQLKSKSPQMACELPYKEAS